MGDTNCKILAITKNKVTFWDINLQIVKDKVNYVKLSHIARHKAALRGV